MNNETCECKCCDLLADKLAAMTKERDRWQEDSMRQAATINRISAAAEDRNEVDQLRHAEHEKYIAAAQAQIAQLREGLVEVCRTHGIHHEALAIPTDTAALDARLKKEYDRGYVDAMLECEK
jgi:hypothetical protein